MNFEDYRKLTLKNRTITAILFMAIPIYMSFSLIDYKFVPDLFWNFLFVRVGVCFLLLIIALVIHFSKNSNQGNIVVFSYLGTLILGIGIGYMCWRTGGLESPYYAGLNFIAIGSLNFWPSPMKHRLLSIFTIYSPLFIFELVTNQNFTSSLSIISISFIIGTIFLSILTNILSFNSMKREHGLREQLEEHLKNKDIIIEQKSQEAATIKGLAKQFSPTVIEAISSNIIALDHRSRNNITIIFIDVVDSTKRSNLLDHQDYHKAMDLFFNMAIKQFLQRNITVANFMGDGLMAIVNSPYAVLEHERVAFEACIEVLKEVKKMQRTFKDLWRDTFSIRIGIGSGMATVGFFPNSDFGVYTAVGDAVNLAARLCRAAENSSIATTKSIIVSATNYLGKCVVRLGGSTLKFKGFGDIDTEYYIATPNYSAVSENQVDLCPLCSSQLKEVAEIADSLILKCTSCKYSDIYPKSEKYKKVA